MSGVITTGSFAKSLWPGVNKWYGDAYNEFPVQYTKLFDTNKSARNYEEDVGVSGFGLAQVKGEGAPTNYDTAQQGFITRYRHVAYSLGFVVSREAFDDDLYDIVAKNKAKGLAFSMRQTKEIVGANTYNLAFSGGNALGDGKQLIDTARPNVAGGTWTNKIATAADLSEAALEQAYIDIRKFTNDRGLRVSFNPKSIIIPPELEFEANRILKSEYRPGTGNNDINALMATGVMGGEVVVNNYLTDPDAWFIRTNCPEGMKYWERKGDEFTMYNDFDTDNAKFKAYSRYSFGCTDPRSIYGSPGA
jgi:hypothetical protein